MNSKSASNSLFLIPVLKFCTKKMSWVFSTFANF
jgi:hypothetical protein